MSQSKKKGGYVVGYGKPPEHTRFQPGQSGNPKGRPRGSLNIVTIFNRALREKLVITENGRRRSMSKLEVAIKGLVNRAVKGDARAMDRLMSMAHLLGEDSGMVTSAVDATDSAVMASITARLGLLSRTADPESE